MSRTKVKQNLIDASFGNVLEYFSYTPDGRTITTTQGDITVTNQTVQTASSATIADTGGSAITYTPPTGTKYVEFTYRGNWGPLDSKPVLHYRIQLDSTDINHSRRSLYYDASNSEGTIFVSAVIEITGSGSDDIANGKVDTWTSGKVLRSAFRSYNSSYDGYANYTSRWDGSNGIYLPGFHTVTAYS